MDFGDLEHDMQIQEKLTNFHNSIRKIEKILNSAVTSELYDKLTLKEKVDYDLFIAYTLNTLYWLYLRTRGIDPNENDVKSQLTRIKEYMMKAKLAHERNTIRPTINQEVAERFIRHGINEHETRTEGPPNKKIRFSE